MLHIRINEKLKVDKNESPKTLKDQIEEALPALEEAIIKRLGNDASLRNFDFGLTVKENTDRSGNPTFTISSKNLVELTGPIGKVMYNEFIFQQNKSGIGRSGETSVNISGLSDLKHRNQFKTKYIDIIFILWYHYIDNV